MKLFHPRPYNSLSINYITTCIKIKCILTFEVFENMFCLNVLDGQIHAGDFYWFALIMISLKSSNELCGDWNVFR